MGLRINNNLASLGAAMNLGRANSALSSSLAKLSTGLKINTASDGPADLIISEKFRSQINSISKATENTQNAISMLSTAEGALAEVNSLLSKMQGLALKAAQTGTQSADEIAASQAEIDAALESINTISRNTSFGSVNLLDGSRSIRTEGVDTSNILVDIDKANFAGDSKNINVNVVSAANRAETTLDLTANAQGGGTDGILTSNQVLKVTGNRGSDTITFASGSSDSSIAEEINSRVSQTGVIAEVNNSIITLKSADYGASEFVTVEDVDGTNDFLDISAGGNGIPVAPTDVLAADLTAGTGLGASFRIGGSEIRTTGANGDSLIGFSIEVTIDTADGAAVAVSDTASKTIAVNASTVTLASIAAAISSATGIAMTVVNGEGALTTLASDTMSGNMTGVTSNLQVIAKEGTFSEAHALAPTLVVSFAGAAAITYNSTTNTINLNVVSTTAYTDATLQAVIDASANANELNGFFDFKMTNGGGLIDRTLASNGLQFTTTSLSNESLSADLRSDDSFGLVFEGDNVAFKTNAFGTEKYAGYTISYDADTTRTGAIAVAIDDGAKLISITVNSTSTNASIVTALNTAAVGAAAFTSMATVTNATAIATTAKTAALAAGGNGLIVTAKGDSGMAAPFISFASSTTYGITYSAGNETLTIAVDGDNANLLDTQEELVSIIDASGIAAQLNGLFDFNVVGELKMASNAAIELLPGGVALGVGGSGTKTNYISTSGTDGSLEVNGVKTAANNLSFTFDNGNIRGHITIDEDFNKAGKSTDFAITGKGAFLQLGGKGQLSHQIGVGIQSVAADQLATGLYIRSDFDPSTANIDNDSLYTTATLADIKAGGDFDLASDPALAYDIISQAITEVSVARSKLGALISNTLESNINSLGVAFENLTAAESRIRDVDFAAETAEFTRAQILVQAGTSVAAQANVATQAALQLLG